MHVSSIQHKSVVYNISQYDDEYYNIVKLLLSEIV